MHKTILLTAFLAVFCLTATEQIRLNPDGTIRFGGSVTLHPFHFNPKWQSTKETTFRGTKTDRGITGNWQVSNRSSEIGLTISRTLLRENESRFLCGFEFRNPVPTAAYGMALRFPVEVIRGKIYTLDGKAERFPEKAARGTVLHRTVSQAEFNTGDGVLSLRFDKPVNIRITDERQYNSDAASMRIELPVPQGSAGKTEIGFTASFVPCTTEPVDISRAVNMGFRDDTADDGKGGWSDQGPENDLRALKSGLLRCPPAEFRILDPERNGGRAAIVIGKTPRHDYASSVTLNLNGRKIKTLFLLHAGAWLPAAGRPVGYLRVTYTDGSEEELPVRAGRDIGNWWEPLTLANGAVAWESENPSAKIGLYASSFELRGGAVRSICLRRSGLTGLWMIAAVSGSGQRGAVTGHDQLHVTRAGSEWKRFQFNRDVEPGSALDFSFLLDAPAGKYGFLQTGNGHFVFEKRKTPVRFYGPNLCFSACFPSHEQSEQLADRFARMGYNVIRLHHFDGRLIPRNGRDSTTLDPQNLDRMEYLIAALKRRGIYVTIDLFISRRPRKGEFPLVENDRDYKLAAMLLPEVNQNLKTYSRNLLTHRNPYTGLPLAADPVLLKISIINENTPFHIISMGTSEGIRRRYRDEFAKRYPGGMKNGTPDETLFRKFLSETYLAYYKDMTAFLRGIGVRAPLTEQNFIASPNLTLHRESYDYVDQHLYWDHPSFPVKPWSLPMKFHGRSAITRRLPSPTQLAPTRLFDRPFAVSEFDFSGPGSQRIQGTPIFAAYAALQDWDALNRFAYSHGLDAMFRPGTIGSFDAANDPTRLLGDRFAAAFFLRGDVTPSKQSIPVVVSPEPQNSYKPHYPEAANEIALFCKTGSVLNRGKETVLPPDTTAVYALDPALKATVWNGFPVQRAPKNTFRRITSSTGELTADFQQGTFRAATPRSEALILPQGKTLDGNILTVRNRKSDCVAGAIALDGQTLAESSRILLLHIADIRNEGLTLRGSGFLVEQWGRGPLMAQKAVAEFSLALPGSGWKLHALNFSGKRLYEVPYKTDGGRLIFTADTFGKTEPVFAYELER